MTKFNTLQLREAGEWLRVQMENSGCDPDDLAPVTLDSIVDDLVNYLERPRSETLRKVVLVPGFGFLPLVGEIVDDEALGNKINFYTEGDRND
jgi:hypothetical protein